MLAKHPEFTVDGPFVVFIRPSQNCLRRPLIAFTCAVLLFVVIPERAHALNFTPSEIEWSTWPDYCRARYVVSAAGKKSKYVHRITSEEVARHERNKGRDAWIYLHHYCAALAYMQRSAAEKNSDKSSFILREAEIEFVNQFEHITPKDRMFPDVVSSIALVHRRRGDYDVALEFLDLAMENQPEAPSPYALAAIICRDAGNMSDGLEFLKKGNSATDGTSAEIHYFLGLFYIDLDDLDAAVRHAERAYELGYPLPGLAAKLRRHGRPLQ